MEIKYDEAKRCILVAHHVKYFKRCLQVLPESLSSLDVNRLTVAFFVVSGIDLLNSGQIFDDEERKRIVNWIYSLQISPKDDCHKIGKYGFKGSSANGTNNAYDFGHLAMIYSALITLITLGDDLKKIDRRAILDGIKELQLEDGSFSAAYGNESDMRFVYCAIATCYILNDFTTIQTDRVVNFILDSLSYEGAFGQGPGLEAHGGSTYCAVASLFLLNKLDALTNSEVARLKRWCIMKQVSGFEGRPNKDPDSCYSFWIGATLQLLDSSHLTNFRTNFDFLISTQDHLTGGLAKYPSNLPDPLHTYLGIGGLSLIPFIQEKNILCPVYPALNMSQRAFEHLLNIQKAWTNGQGLLNLH